LVKIIEEPDDRVALEYSFLRPGSFPYFLVMSKVHTPLMPLTPASGSMRSEFASTPVLAAVDSTSHFEQVADTLSDRTLAAVAHGIVTLDQRGQIVFCNPKARKWAAIEPIGCRFEQVFRLCDEPTQAPLPNMLTQLYQEPQGFVIQGRAVLSQPQADSIAIDLTVTPLQTATGELSGAVILLQDVTHSRQAAKVLSWQIAHDPLTGLANRSEFEIQLQRSIAQVHQQQSVNTLCYIDLDQFKIINDTCGHQGGDQLLRQLAQLLRQEVRQSDLLARVGGDEFSIILYDCDGPAAQAIAARIHQQITQLKFGWEGNDFSIGASFGLVPIDGAHDDPASVLSAADAACYAAKEAGRNRIHLYDHEDHQLTHQRSERLWISQIYQAIAEQRFELYAQDIVPVQPQDTIGGDGFERHVEILLRMRGRDGQMIAPGCFIPVAERYGLMTDLDRVVIETFFRTYETACLTSSGRPIDTCLYAINLSARSLNDPEFIDFVRSQFVRYRVPPEVICFEITETVAIANIEQASQFIQELKQMGCHFALDDFGSGMNCFAYLKQLQIDYLKIDGSFIKNIVQEKVDQEFVNCMNRIAHVLGVKTVAEWVENDEILQILRDLEIDYAQGYGLHRPEPLLELLNGPG
jgi:diguanylate cyclase (GGDEF)-like protein